MIKFFQRTMPLAEMGVVVECRRLPQDKYTAAVVLAVLGTSNPDPWPGAYIAHIDDGADADPYVLDSDDLLVKQAKEVIRRFGRSDLGKIRKEIVGGH